MRYDKSTIMRRCWALLLFALLVILSGCQSVETTLEEDHYPYRYCGFVEEIDADMIPDPLKQDIIAALRSELNLTDVAANEELDGANFEVWNLEIGTMLEADPAVRYIVSAEIQVWISDNYMALIGFDRLGISSDHIKEYNDLHAVEIAYEELPKFGLRYTPVDAEKKEIFSIVPKYDTIPLRLLFSHVDFDSFGPHTIIEDVQLASIY